MAKKTKVEGFSGEKNFIGYFPRKYGEDNLLNDLHAEIVKKADEKNSNNRKNGSYVDTATIQEEIKRIQAKYGATGFDSGMSPEDFRNFAIELLDVAAKNDLSFNPETYIAHMLSGEFATPGGVGAEVGMYMHGNHVTGEVSPFSNVLEREVSDKIKLMLGYKREDEGFSKAVSYITSGGTEANILALLLGRNWSYLNIEGVNVADKGLAPAVTKSRKAPKVIMPMSAHYSFDKSMNALGLGKENVIWINSDKSRNFGMDMSDLERKLGRVIESGKEKVLAAVTVFGSTELGAVDDIARFYGLIDKFEKVTTKNGKPTQLVWKHLDAAYGAPVMLLDRYKGLLDIVPKFDSVTFDPHKLLWTPYGSGSLTVKNALTLRTISTDAPYIGNEDINSVPNEKFIEELFQHMGAVKMVGSQGTSGVISAYLALAAFGRDGLREIIETTNERTRYLSAQLQRASRTLEQQGKGRIEVMNPEPDMDLLTWRFIPSAYSSSSSGVETNKDTWTKLSQYEREQINLVNKGIESHFRQRDEHEKTQERHIISKTTLKYPVDFTEIWAELPEEECRGMDFGKLMGKYGIVVQRAVIMNPHTSEKNIDEFVQKYADYVRSIPITK